MVIHLTKKLIVFASADILLLPNKKFVLSRYAQPAGKHVKPGSFAGTHALEPHHVKAKAHYKSFKQNTIMKNMVSNMTKNDHEHHAITEMGIRDRVAKSDLSDTEKGYYENIARQIEEINKKMKSHRFHKTEHALEQKHASKQSEKMMSGMKDVMKNFGDMGNQSSESEDAKNPMEHISKLMNGEDGEGLLGNMDKPLKSHSPHGHHPYDVDEHNRFTKEMCDELEGNWEDYKHKHHPKEEHPLITVDHQKLPVDKYSEMREELCTLREKQNDFLKEHNIDPEETEPDNHHGIEDLTKIISSDDQHNMTQKQKLEIFEKVEARLERCERGDFDAECKSWKDKYGKMDPKDRPKSSRSCEEYEKLCNEEFRICEELKAQVFHHHDIHSKNKIMTDSFDMSNGMEGIGEMMKTIQKYSKPYDEECHDELVQHVKDNHIQPHNEQYTVHNTHAENESHCEQKRDHYHELKEEERTCKLKKLNAGYLEFEEEEMMNFDPSKMFNTDEL